MVPDTFHVAVVGEKGSAALNCIPSVENVKFHIVSELDDFSKLPVDVQSVVVVQPFDIKTLINGWSKAPFQENVKFLHSFFAGVDQLEPFITKSLAEKENILLTNGRGAFSASLAEYIMTSCLFFNKKISTLQANKKDRNWDKFTMPVLRNKTIGFVGFGDIAKTTAKIAKESFSMKIAAYRKNPEKTDVLIDKLYLDSNELFQNSDFVVCTLPGTSETRNFCSAQFSKMKPGSVFISCGRGSAVDENALYIALQVEQQIFAALDVFEKEPLPRSSPLWSVDEDRLLLSSHNADYTDDYYQLGWQVFIDNMQQVMQGKTPLTLVDKTKLY